MAQGAVGRFVFGVPQTRPQIESEALSKLSASLHVE
jgi:hypothetical protein